MRAAAAECKISYASVRAKESVLKNNSGDEYRARFEDDKLPEPIPHEELKPEAARALEDFAYFRRRYFGRISTPWQEEAAYRIIEFLDSKRKEFVVINAPPGSGKSTTFTLDIPAWITVKRRGIRGLMGSASQTLAERYLLRLRTALESPYLALAEEEDLANGLAVDAEATLAEDFGFFKPEKTTLWKADAFIVAQFGNRTITQMEPTWSAYGLDTAFIGGRYDFCMWDDLVEEKHVATLEAIEKQRGRWDKVAEKRLEPAGLTILQGQRLSPEDLYRYCLDKKAGATSAVDHDGCCEAVTGSKYHHIRFRAHWEDRCAESHDESAPYYPEGCLLDPRRLSWEDLESEMANAMSNYMQVYQQEDADPEQLLVNPMWIAGGTDPKTGEIYPGCWDKDRSIGEFPNIAGPRFSVVTADPSPTNFWSIQWWIYTPESEFRWLMDHHRHKMGANDFLDWNNADQRFVGIMEEWQVRSVERGLPITHWIVEQNAAQRFMLQYEHVKRWMAKRDVSIVGHDTYGANKSDPKLGVTSIRNHYKYGRVRLPGSQDPYTRGASNKLIDEVTKWPKGRFDDCVMAHWFLEWNLPNLYRGESEVVRLSVPSWMAGAVA